MNANAIILFLLLALIGAMYYWTSIVPGINGTISMVVIAILGYLLGRNHQKKIDLANSQSLKSSQEDY
jgi:uncharacterized membrane protein (UPF0136 family)